MGRCDPRRAFLLPREARGTSLGPMPLGRERPRPQHHRPHDHRPQHHRPQHHRPRRQPISGRPLPGVGADMSRLRLSANTVSVPEPPHLQGHSQSSGAHHVWRCADGDFSAGRPTQKGPPLRCRVGLRGRRHQLAIARMTMPFEDPGGRMTACPMGTSCCLAQPAATFGSRPSQAPPSAGDHRGSGTGSRGSGSACGAVSVRRP